MRSLLLTMLLLFSLASIAQTLKPADLVAEQNNAFKPVELLTKSFSQDLSELKGFTQGVLLELDVNALRTMRKNSSRAIELKLNYKDNRVFTLQLVKVNIFRDDYIQREEPSGEILELDNGDHYRGIIKGNNQSLAAISVYDDEVVGFIADPQELGNLVIGRLDAKSGLSSHIIYEDAYLERRLKRMCSVNEDEHGEGYEEGDLDHHHQEKALTDCVGLFMEIDYNVTQARGGTAQANTYLTTLFNGVSTIYANENINTKLSASVVWSAASPYTGTNASARLNSFQSNRNNFNGDLANLITNINFGGVAATINGICAAENSRMCVSGVVLNIAALPTYSFDVEVTAHEFGHLFGSYHTHGCYWNGNNTQIDDCGNKLQFDRGQRPEGNGCFNNNNLIYPNNGGTVMSYCYATGGVGINFSNGFGTQPGNAIRNVINNASCLNPCNNTGGGCSDNEFTLTIQTDNYPAETTWLIKNSGGTTVASGGPYTAANSPQTKDICLPDGCYTFTINDSYGDGICCSYGNGSYSLTGPSGVVASGASFTNSASTNFCEQPTSGSDCTSINFNDYTVVAYGNGQDNGTSSKSGNGTTLSLANNAWKSIPINYTVTANTKVSFEFKSTAQGEIHGLGFDTDAGLSANRTFQLYGTQNWGNRDFDYTTTGSYQAFTIPVGTFYTGAFNRLFFVMDHDNGSKNGNSSFRNLKIFEGASCNSAGIGESQGNAIEVERTADVPVAVYPNPSTGEFTIEFTTQEEGKVDIKILDLVGQIVSSKLLNHTIGTNSVSMKLTDFPSGVYLINLTIGNKRVVKKLNLIR